MEYLLNDRRILVVEDEYMFASDMKAELESVGATVLGPVGSVKNATALICAEQHLDAALLDINLGDEMVFEVADLLVERNVPFVFTTGYDSSVIPVRFSHVAHYEKPLNVRHVTQALSHEILSPNREAKL